jgi:hypothetical protein
MAQEVGGLGERVHDGGDVRELLLDRIAVRRVAASPRPRRSTEYSVKRSVSRGSTKRKLERSTLVPWTRTSGRPDPLRP